MPAERTADFGSRLRDARERKGMSLSEIATATKISSRILDALERNDITRLPGGIFSRSFVRAYAEEVGLDPEAAVEDFIRQFPHDSITAGHPPSTRIDDNDSIESDRRMAAVVLRLLAISLPIAGIVLYFGMTSGRDTAVDAQPASTSTARTNLPQGASGTVRSERPSHLTVEVMANRACSVSATVDAPPPADLRLVAGERRTFEVGRELLLRVSDPSAIEWTINGVAGRPLGPPGAPAAARVTLDNYDEFLAAR
jgi:transcriptional regulator with XRE-family HTH domain